MPCDDWGNSLDTRLLWVDVWVGEVSRWLLAVRREGNFILISGCGEEAQDTMVGSDFMENMNFSKRPIWSKICPMLQKIQDGWEISKSQLHSFALRKYFEKALDFIVNTLKHKAIRSKFVHVLNLLASKRKLSEITHVSVLGYT